jgi:hypothetical protein
MPGTGSILRTATLCLTAVALSVTVGTTVLLINHDVVPDGLIALGSAAVGALATLMTTSSYEANHLDKNATYTRTTQEQIVPGPSNGDQKDGSVGG